MKKNSTDENLTMLEFITAIIEESYDPKLGANIIRSLLFTTIGTMLLLPFGFRAISIPRPLTKYDLVVKIESMLYSAFDTKFFENGVSKAIKYKRKNEYSAYLDQLPTKMKGVILSLVLNQPEIYQNFVKSESWRKKQAA